MSNEPRAALRPRHKDDVDVGRSATPSYNDAQPDVGRSATPSCNDAQPDVGRSATPSYNDAQPDVGRSATPSYNDALPDVGRSGTPSYGAHELAGPHFDQPGGGAVGPEQIRTVDLHKSYRKGPIEVPVLKGVNLRVRQGEFLAVIGQSGSGKSTLLHLLGTLDAPDKGEIHFDGRRIDNLASGGRDALRNYRFGMIFQFYHLLPELSTLENVLAPLMIRQGVVGYFRRRHGHRKAATEILKMLGLGHRLTHKPSELSGGEMQRAAIARALVTDPELLLADEPTGNLDHATGQGILEVLRTLNRRRNLTIVMVTHDQAIAAQADRTVQLADGRIVW